MPQKDFYEKKLEDFDDVFSDILNVLLFHGRQTVLPDALETGTVRSAYKIEGKFEEQVASFQSDFRYVAEFFVQNRLEKEGKQSRYQYSLKHIRHVHEFMDLMNALTGSRNFDTLEKIIEEGEKETMETVFERREARGEARGEVKGRNNRLIEQIKKKLARDKTFEQIVDECESTPDEIRPFYEKILEEMKAGSAV